MTEEKWLYWCDTVHDPYFNMSMDEVLLSNSALQENRVLVRIYRWDRPSVSFGSAQICPAELADFEEVRVKTPRNTRFPHVVRPAVKSSRTVCGTQPENKVLHLLMS